MISLLYLKLPPPTLQDSPKSLQIRKFYLMILTSFWYNNSNDMHEGDTRMGKKIKKSLGAVGKLISFIPDTTEVIGKTIDNTRPIIEKHMEYQHAKTMNIIHLDDVINLPVDKAQEHLEHLGFVVATLPIKPHKKWVTAHINEVVAMSPKSGKHRIGSLVKLYYVTIDVIEKSQELLDQENLRAVERNQKLADTVDSLKKIKLPFAKK